MEVVYFAATSMDGCIATATGGVEWLDDLPGPEHDHGFAEFYAGLDALLMGRRTYDFACAQAEWMAEDRPTWVFTHREAPLAHPSVTLTGADPTDLVRELHAAGHRRAWLVGGGELAGAFLERGLITEVIVTMVPVILGGGVPLFGRSARGRALRQVAVRELPGGLTQLTYRMAAD